MLGIKEIQEILPHRHPFLLVDCIEEYDPGLPVMPGVLIMEALAQTGAVAILSKEENKGKVAFFGGMDKVKFKRKVVPGDRLKLSCEIIKQKGPLGVGKAVATVDGEIAAMGELTFMVG